MVSIPFYQIHTNQNIDIQKEEEDEWFKEELSCEV